MELIKKFNDICKKNREKLAIKTTKSTLSYKQLFLTSNSFSSFINDKITSDNSPIIVLGNNQNCEVLPIFFACLKSGHAYLPIDNSTPINRIYEIIDNSNPSLILDLTGKIDNLDREVLCINIKEFHKICDLYMKKIFEYPSIKYNNIAYIIYTSGSSGKAKGVKISYNALITFTKWLEKELISSIKINNNTILNPALISFDFNIFSIMISIFSNSTVLAVDRELLKSHRNFFDFIISSKLNIWVSTPSLLKLLLFNEEFQTLKLPFLKKFIIGGEIVSSKICSKILERFNKVKIYNIYGPTEATMVVSKIEINDEMIYADDEIPIGDKNSSCTIEIIKEDKILKDGDIGEIVLSGDVLSEGYINNIEETKKYFFQNKDNLKRYYKTGDLGYRKNGKLYFVGRKDNQIKLHGYRIELEDIENNIKKLDYVEDAVVFPNVTNGEIKFLVSMVNLTNKIEKNINFELKLKKDLLNLIPNYMIPKIVKFVEQFPLNINSKLDKRKVMDIFYDSL